jgi:putative hemolysin
MARLSRAMRALSVVKQQLAVEQNIVLLWRGRFAYPTIRARCDPAMPGATDQLLED